MAKVRNLVKMYTDGPESVEERQRQAIEEIHQSLVHLDAGSYETHSRRHVFVVMGASVSACCCRHVLVVIVK